jgi:hypothetical protein
VIVVGLAVTYAAALAVHRLRGRGSKYAPTGEAGAAPPRVVVLAGASLLGSSLAVAILLGPWAARWFLVALWLLAAGAFGYLGIRRRHVEPATRSFGGPYRRSVFALALGFAGLAAATAVRALAGGRVALVWILYAVAGVGMVGSLVLLKDSYRPTPKQ